MLERGPTFRISTSSHTTPCPWHARPPQISASHGLRRYKRAAAAIQKKIWQPDAIRAFPSQHNSSGKRQLVREYGRRRSPPTVKCEGEDEGEKPSSNRRPPPKRSRKPLGWLRQVLASARSQKAVRVLVNVMGLLLLMRFWPLNGRNPLTGQAANMSLEVRSNACTYQPLVMGVLPAFEIVRQST